MFVLSHEGNRDAIIVIHWLTHHSFKRCTCSFFIQLESPELKFSGPDKLKRIDYFEHLRDAKFCLAPRGESSWTLRFYEAFFVVCFPILSLSFPFAKTEANLLLLSLAYGEQFSWTGMCTSNSIRSSGVTFSRCSWLFQNFNQVTFHQYRPSVIGLFGINTR